MHPTEPLVYLRAESKANEIESELQRLNRWQNEPLAPEKYEDMGAFGSKTMDFEQWLQFILIPSIREIARTKDEFPEQSSLSRYAFRIFRDSTETDDLHQLLYDLDCIINDQPEAEPEKPLHSNLAPQILPTETTSAFAPGISQIPPVLFTLAEVLPQFKGADLESQLQTFDTFLAMLNPALRISVSNMLRKAAGATADDLSKARIRKAADAVAMGGRAAMPYDHEAQMKKYTNQHQENFKKF